jgi:CRISPR/Cas system-associated protein Csm6
MRKAIRTIKPVCVNSGSVPRRILRSFALAAKVGPVQAFSSFRKQFFGGIADLARRIHHSTITEK